MQNQSPIIDPNQLQMLIAQATGRQNATGMGPGTPPPGAAAPPGGAPIANPIGPNSVDPQVAAHMGANMGDQMSLEMANKQRDEAMALRDGAMPGMRHTRATSVAAHPAEFLVAGLKARQGKKAEAKHRKTMENKMADIGLRGEEIAAILGGNMGDRDVANQMHRVPGQTSQEKLLAGFLRNK